MVTTAFVLYRHHKGIVATWNLVDENAAHNLSSINRLHAKLERQERELAEQGHAVTKLCNNDGVFLHQISLLSDRVDKLTGEQGVRVEVTPEEDF